MTEPHFFFLFPFDEESIRTISSAMTDATETATAPENQVRYVRGRLLGRGQVADVYEATQFCGPEDKDGRTVALKVVDLGDILTASAANASDDDGDAEAGAGDEPAAKTADEPELDMAGILEEMRVLTRVECPYLARYLDARVVYATGARGGEAQNDELQIAMELYNAGSAYDVMKSLYPLPGDAPFFTEAELRFVLRRVLLGLDFLHARGIPHSGIKASNVLLSCGGADDVAVRLTDYGVFEQLQYQVSKRDTFLQSPFWMAPEIITQKTASGSTDSDMFSLQSDIWMLGITAIELVTGTPPLFFEHAMKALFDIPKLDPAVYIDGLEKDAPRSLEPLNKIRDKLNAHFSTDFKDFLRACLVLNPADRWTAKRLLAEHPFLTHATTAEEDNAVRRSLAHKFRHGSSPAQHEHSHAPAAAAAAAAPAAAPAAAAATPAAPAKEDTSKVLNTVIYPILTKLLSQQQQQPPSEEFITAIARLKMAFDNLEKNKNGSVLLFSKLVIAQLSQISKK